MLIEQIMVGPMGVFCYIISDEDTREAIIIDPSSEHEKITEYIDRYGLNVTKIINTHGHIDHTSGNLYFIETTGAELFIHEKDYFYLEITGTDIRKYLKRWNSSGDRIRLLRDGDKIVFGSHIIQIIHTPGHSPGSICIYCDGNLFTGDTLFTEGVGRTDISCGQGMPIIDSIKSRILTLPDDTIIWPGHHYGRYPVSTIREQKKYYL